MALCATKKKKKSTIEHKLTNPMRLSVGTCRFIKSARNRLTALIYSSGITTVYPQTFFISWLTNPMTFLYRTSTLDLSNVQSLPAIRPSIVLLRSPASRPLITGLFRIQKDRALEKLAGSQKAQNTRIPKNWPEQIQKCCILPTD